MTGKLNLVKLCVGVEHPDELMAWQQQRITQTGYNHPTHVTRMWPRRADELLNGGSLYWVMRGEIKARQAITDLKEVRGEDGIRRCCIILGQDMIRTVIVPRRAFQGWRYLDVQSAPEDLPDGSLTDDVLPDELASALVNLGVR